MKISKIDFGEPSMLTYFDHPYLMVSQFGYATSHSLYGSIVGNTIHSVLELKEFIEAAHDR